MIHNLYKKTLKVTFIGLALASAGCVAVAPMPGSNNQSSAQNEASMDRSGGQGGKDTAQNQAPKCTIVGEKKQDLSQGTATVVLTQSCKKTELYIANNHPDEPKKCKVIIGDQGAQLYIQPGENRTLTHMGPVQQSHIYVNCVNDWNRTK